MGHNAPITTHAASAEQATTAQPAVTECDPRKVITPLDPSRVEACLRDLGLLEKWAHIVDGLRHGFDVGVREPVLATHTPQNHASASMDPASIDAYITEEQAAGRYSNAFDVDHLEALIGPFRSAPLGLVPKPHSDKLRLIQDLSYPRNDVRLSCTLVTPTPTH